MVRDTNTVIGRSPEGRALLEVLTGAQSAPHPAAELDTVAWVRTIL